MNFFLKLKNKIPLTSIVLIKALLIIIPLEIFTHYSLEFINPTSLSNPFLDAVILSLLAYYPFYIFIFKPLINQETYKAKTLYNALNEIAIVSESDEKGNITFANKNFQSISGYCEKELLGKNHSILNSQKNPRGTFLQMWNTIKNHQIWRGDIINKTKNGNFYHVDSTIIPIYNQPGSIKGYLSVRLDITSKKEQAEKIFQTNQKLEAILKSMNFSIITTDTSGIITSFNKEAERILGYTSEEVVGIHSPALFHDKNEIVSESSILSAEFQVPVSGFETFIIKAKNNIFYEKEWSYINKSGDVIPVLLNITSIKDTSGEIIGYMGIGKDLSESKKIQKQIEVEKNKVIHASRMSSLGELAAGVAHEINNPLAIISGNLNLIKKDNSVNSMILKRIDTAEKSIVRISKIILGLKKFSRINEEEYNVEINPNQLIEEALNLTNLKAKNHNVPISYSFKDCESSYIRGNDCELEQVLINLINNSIDAISLLPDKWIKINCSITNNILCISITDSGQGISSEILDKLFDPFFTTKEVGKGTGLGLSISKGIIEKHKGTLTVNLEKPNTCFEINLPVFKKEIV